MIVRDAELRGEKVTEDMRAEEARLRQDVGALKRLRHQFIEEVRGTLARYERLLAGEPATEGGDDDRAS